MLKGGFLWRHRKLEELAGDFDVGTSRDQRLARKLGTSDKWRAILKVVFLRFSALWAALQQEHGFLSIAERVLAVLHAFTTFVVRQVQLLHEVC